MTRFEITVEPAPPFEPPEEVAWTETGRMYHRFRADRRTIPCVGADVSYISSRDRIRRGDEPCDRCFRVR
jgi:hypothetical protein